MYGYIEVVKLFCIDASGYPVGSVLVSALMPTQDFDMRIVGVLLLVISNYHEEITERYRRWIVPIKRVRGQDKARTRRNGG